MLQEVSKTGSSVFDVLQSGAKAKNLKTSNARIFNSRTVAAVEKARLYKCFSAEYILCLADLAKEKISQPHPVFHRSEFRLAIAEILKKIDKSEFMTYKARLCQNIYLATRKVGWQARVTFSWGPRHISSIYRRSLFKYFKIV